MQIISMPRTLLPILPSAVVDPTFDTDFVASRLKNGMCIWMESSSGRMCYWQPVEYLAIDPDHMPCPFRRRVAATHLEQALDDWFVASSGEAFDDVTGLLAYLVELTDPQEPLCAVEPIVIGGRRFVARWEPGTSAGRPSKLKLIAYGGPAFNTGEFMKDAYVVLSRPLGLM